MNDPIPKPISIQLMEKVFITVTPFISIFILLSFSTEERKKNNLIVIEQSKKNKK